MPQSPSTASPDPGSAKKVRAKHACRVCNSRRVKCNVTEVQPCTNCSSAGVVCEVIPSRRGRYPRRSKRSDATAASSPGASQPTPLRPNTRGAAARQSHASASGTPGQQPPVQSPAHHPTGHHSDHQHSHVPSPSRTTSCPPEPDALFFGESNFLTLVPGSKANSTPGTHTHPRDHHHPHRQRQRHMFPVPETPPSASDSPATGGASRLGGAPSPAATHSSSHISASTMRYLRDEGALDLPDLQTCLPALQAYFTWFHPCFPVVDRADIIRRLTSTDPEIRLSRILLQSMLFVGATYCTDDTITAMGFSDRAEAKYKLYGKARILFHADHETDRMALIQAVFLMSFWRGGPSDVRDVRYWLGVVITLAESHGLHRSSEKVMAGGDSRLAKMRRRIWWSIYVRERQAAASLGLPSRIRDEDCDIEALSAQDLESEGEMMAATTTGHAIFGACQPQHVAYVVRMVEIARLLGRIIDVQFVPGKRTVTANAIEGLDNSLEAWKNSLPSDMQYSDDGTSSLWTCLLHLAYNHSRILIHRNGFLQPGEQNRSEQIVIGAACRISRIAEDMSAQGTLRYGQMHIITSLFAALCIHTICIRRTTDMSQRIAEHRAQLCLLCLKEVQKYWRINNNVLDLFLHYLDGSIAKRLHGAGAGSRDDAEHQSTETSTATMNSRTADGMTSASAPITPAASHANTNTDTISVDQGAITLAPAVSSGTQGGEMAMADLFEEQYLSLVNGQWDMDDAQGELGLFLKGDEFMQEGLGFLGRSL